MTLDEIKADLIAQVRGNERIQISVETLVELVHDCLEHLELFAVETEQELFKNADGLKACSRHCFHIVDQVNFGIRHLPSTSPEEVAGLFSKTAMVLSNLADYTNKTLGICMGKLRPNQMPTEAVCDQRYVATVAEVKRVVTALHSIQGDLQALLQKLTSQSAAIELQLLNLR